MKVAIVDIGSNAIRACIYLDHSFGSPVIFHKIISCNLKLLSHDINNYDHPILHYIRYLVNIIKHYDISHIKCVATAVLRNYNKSQELLDIIKKNCNLDINILSGEQEATLVGTSIIHNIPDAKGVIIDMGGGSIEFISVNKKQIERTFSFNFNSNINNSYKLQELYDFISYNFQNLYDNNNLYLVGGSFRNIGNSYIYGASNNNNIVSHNLSITVKDFYQYIKSIKYQDNLTIAQQNATSIIEFMLRINKINNIVFSNYGLTEGIKLLYYTNKEDLKKDIVLTKLLKITGFNESFDTLETKYLVIRNLMLKENLYLKKMLYIAIILINYFSNYIHEVKYNLVHDFIMSINVPLNHEERISIIIILSIVFFRYIPKTLIIVSKEKLQNKEYIISNILGNYIKILSSIDGLLSKKCSFSLKKSEYFIEIVSDYILPETIYHKIQFNLKNLNYCVYKYNLY